MELETIGRRLVGGGGVKDLSSKTLFFLKRSIPESDLGLVIHVPAAQASK
jgi:hypothetical protein